MTSIKHALVFGGSRGIGGAIVRRLARDGARVSFTFVAREDSARNLAEEIAGAGGEAFPIRADSADAAQIQAAVGAAVKQHGPIDTLVVNAGLFRMATVDAVSLEDLDQMLAVNVRGVFLAVQAAAGQLNDGGRVVLIGSNVTIRTGMAGASVYQFTKAAVAAMAKGLALDLAPRKITVNTVQPGPTDTDINAGAVDTLAAMSPLKRVAHPDEIAGLVAYLAGPEAGYVTGTSLTIDGGFTL
ncbi:SDR family oxidoreductase [Sphingobium yanoikuyae]|uniref:Oxidoreductase n=1 Tax=Sphingobium yanoikuyae TaxID=13690 RepID=A0A291MZL3_SPHYA|nr:SDR family oxidoreductase [Sphingobium yanoikuyae]ATI80526.1 oxidoreductase [Sphingobium yanoikuyae]